MGLIKAIAGAAGGVMADQWKEFFTCEALPADVLAVKGQKKTTRRSSNTHGDENIITSGSRIAVADGQCMLIVEQGKVVEVCAEPGEYTYDASTEPTIFAGQLVAVTLWFEKRQRATANSLCTVGGSLGAVIAPLVIAWLMRWFSNWQEVFLVAGVAGLVIAGLWMVVYRTPSQEILDRTVNVDRMTSSGEEQKSFTLGGLFRTRTLWGAFLIRLISDPVWYFCCFWLPGYLRGMGEAQNLTHEQTLNMIQWIGGIPFLVGALGGILTSVWSDSMIKRGRSALSARKVMLMAVVVVAPLCAAVPYVGASETLSFAWRVGLVVAIFSLVAVMCLSWLYTLPVVLAETFPIKNVASVMGICCGAGALGSVVFNQFVGSIPSEAWYTLFAIMGTLHIIAAVVLWKMVRPESPETK